MEVDPLDSRLALPAGPVRTAAVTAWFQGLYREESDTPVLVGGGAVELYTGGAYRTGDLDFVGRIPPEVGRRLEAAGFLRKGRHWVREAGEVYIELPAVALDRPQRVAMMQVDEWRVVLISLEDILVDRLAGWTFWRSDVHGINAFLLLRSQRDEVDQNRLGARAKDEGVEQALVALERFHRAIDKREPTLEEISEWARSGP